MDLRFHCARTQWNRDFNALSRRAWGAALTQGRRSALTGNRLSGAEVKSTLTVSAS